MALQMPVLTDHGIQLTNAYIRIDELSGGKIGVSVRVRFYANLEACQQGCIWLKEEVHAFIPDVSENADNFLKQGYEHIKTIPDFALAADC